MANAKKAYPYTPVLLYNIACDIAEMYKAKITEDKVDRFSFITEIYGLKTKYIFLIEKQTEGCVLSVESEGDDEQAEKQLLFMLSIVDNMLTTLGGSG